MMTLFLIGGGLFLVMLVSLAMAARSTVRGTCPACRTEVGLAHGVGVCDACGEALRAGADARFEPAPAGFSPDYTAFVTHLGRMKPAAQWRPVWPGQCCVCGEVATRTDRMKIKEIEGQAGPMFTPTNLTSTHRFEVGYCDRHRDGLRYAYPPGMGYAKQPSQCLLAFRSADFYRAFVARNGGRR